MGSPSVIVTRPVREAVRWVGELQAAGVDAVALPLIAIEPLDDTTALDAACRRMGDYAALMFVSAAAVDHFFAAAGTAPAIADQRYWATGPGTAKALRRAGVPASAIDVPDADAGRFDSEVLWERVQPQLRQGTRVLIVRGGDASGHPTGRDWLAREVAAATGACDTVVAYRRLAPPLAGNDRRIAEEAVNGRAIWLFSSSEAIANLLSALPFAGWKSARAIATHPRIADAARDAGFGLVHVAQPSVAAVVASIESFG